MTADLSSSPLVSTPATMPEIWPCAELGPTAMMTQRPMPSSTREPEKRTGAVSVSFSTSSASPVKWLSSSLHNACAWCCTAERMPL